MPFTEAMARASTQGFSVRTYKSWERQKKPLLSLICDNVCASVMQECSQISADNSSENIVEANEVFSASYLLLVLFVNVLF